MTFSPTNRVGWRSERSRSYGLFAGEALKDSSMAYTKPVSAQMILGVRW